jgi:hypothetical protein
MLGSEVWTRFAHDPRRSENAHLRAGDRDRDVVNDVLGEAVADGRLTLQELDERTDRLAAAKTLGELPDLIHDLVPVVSRELSKVERLATPETRRAEAERRYRAERRNALLGFLYPSLICLAIWGWTDFGGFFWPAFVILACAGRPAYLVLNRDDRIQAIERGIERRRTKAINAREHRDQHPAGPLPESGAPDH